MYKEMLVIPVSRVVDPKRIIRKRRAKEEERHKGSLTHKKLWHIVDHSRSLSAIS
jgi:hypothetical protein